MGPPPADLSGLLRGWLMPVKIRRQTCSSIWQEAREYRLGSTRMAKLWRAAVHEEWEQVEVRSPLEAVASSECALS